MLAMAVVHKGGGGGGGGGCVSKSMEEEDDILTTLRRLRQTLHECHGRVGVMDKQVDALQPKINKQSFAQDQKNSSWSHIHPHSPEVDAKQSMLHLHSTDTNAKQMTNGGTNGIHIDEKIMDPEELDRDEVSVCDDFDTGRREDFGKVDLGKVDLGKVNLGVDVYSNEDLLQNVSTRADLLHLAEKHANEIYNMYQSTSSPVRNEKTFLYDSADESENGLHITEIKRQNSSDYSGKEVPFADVTENHENDKVNGDVLSRINGLQEVNLTEKPKYRNFAKKREWWSERRKEIDVNRKEMLENENLGINEEKECSSREKYIANLINGDNQACIESTTVFREHTDSQNIFKYKEEISNRLVIPDGIALNDAGHSKRRRRLVRSNSLDLDDIPEECLSPRSLQKENLEEKCNGYNEKYLSSSIAIEDYKETPSHMEDRELMDNKNCSEIKDDDNNLTTVDPVESLGVPVRKLNSSLDVVEKSLDHLRERFFELYDTFKHLAKQEDSNQHSCTSQDLFESKSEYFQSNLSEDKECYTAARPVCALHSSKTCRCDGSVWKNKRDNITSQGKLYQLSDVSRKDYKANKLRTKRRQNIVDKLTKFRGSEKVTLFINKDDLAELKARKDSRSISYTFIFVPLLMLLLFACYILLTVPIVTLSVKHNGGSVAF